MLTRAWQQQEYFQICKTAILQDCKRMRSYLIETMVVNASVSNYENRFFVFALVWHCKRLCIIWCIHQYRFSIRLSFYIENLMDTTQKIEIVTKFYINKYPYYYISFLMILQTLKSRALLVDHNYFICHLYLYISQLFLQNTLFTIIHLCSELK